MMYARPPLDPENADCVDDVVDAPFPIEARSVVRS